LHFLKVEVSMSIERPAITQFPLNSSYSVPEPQRFLPALLLVLQAVPIRRILAAKSKQSAISTKIKEGRESFIILNL
jgi:hypothetical protein